MEDVVGGAGDANLSCSWEGALDMGGASVSAGDGEGEAAGGFGVASRDVSMDGTSESMVVDVEVAISAYLY